MSAVSDDEPDDSESMSIIPYDTHRDVVLRNANSEVYFDPKSRQLSLRNLTRDIDTHNLTNNDCPTCHRPWTRNVSSPTNPDPVPGTEEQPTFINHDYFRMLARSLPGSSKSSGPPSPHRKTIQPARSRLGSPPMISPPNAEFLSSAPAPPSPTHGISETAFAPQYFEKFFIIEKELGKGARGVVLLVKHVLDGVALGQFACKRVPIGDDHTWLEKVLVEVQALQSLSHQNLVSYRHVWLEDYQLSNFGPSVPCAFILQQYCNGGDLHNYVCGPAKASITTQELKDRMRRRSRGEADLPRKSNEAKKLSFDEIYAFFRDITAGLRWLHLNGFIHRDLKPSNCLLHTIGGETRVLVSDFGEVQYENATRKSTGATGTISYCAPEVLQRETPDGPFGNFSFKSDIFSLGMILHFLCFANLPYRFADVLHEEREDLSALRAEIMAWPGFDDHRRLRPELPAKLYSFMKRLLSLQAEDRPTADEVNNGIRLGGLDQIPEVRRRQSMAPEELTPGKRVQKIDTPVRGISPRRDVSHDMPQNSPAGLFRRRTSSKELGSVSDANEKSAEHAIDDDQHATGFELERSLSPPTEPTASMSMVTKASSPSVSPPPRSPGFERRQQLLLPPPPQSVVAATGHRIQIYGQALIVSPTLQVSILAFKLFTALQPCMTRGMNAAVVYPVLALALLELVSSPLRVWKLMAAMLLHITILWYSISKGTLCQRESVLWREQ